MSGHEHDYTGCICGHCAEAGQPILQIIRHHDGFWEFACGADDHDDDEFVGLCASCDGGALKAHKSGLALKPGEWAGRETVSADWEIFLLPEEEDE